MFREVVQDMISKGEIDGRSAYDSLKSHNVPGDYKYVLIEKKMTHDAVLPLYEKVTLELYQLLRKLSLADHILNHFSKHTIYDMNDTKPKVKIYSYDFVTVSCNHVFFYVRFIHYMYM